MLIIPPSLSLEFHLGIFNLQKKNKKKSQIVYLSYWILFNFFLIFIFTLFYFTILYWFCHTLTWIHHECTWVPKHEPPSHLPPHIISLDHPHAPAPSILCAVSNIDWRFISYMIVYMFQCHSPKSSHPLPLPQSPKVRSIHLRLFCCKDCLLILFIVSFVVQKLLSRSPLLTFAFISITVGGGPQRILLWVFVYGVRKCSSFNLLM